MESMWSQFQNLNGIILSKSTELLGWYRIHCGDQCQTSWASRNPIFEYQLSWNLINAYQELNFFIFKCGVFHIISDFYLPLVLSQNSWPSRALTPDDEDPYHGTWEYFLRNLASAQTCRLTSLLTVTGKPKSDAIYIYLQYMQNLR